MLHYTYTDLMLFCISALDSLHPGDYFPSFTSLLKQILTEINTSKVGRFALNACFFGFHFFWPWSWAYRGKQPKTFFVAQIGAKRAPSNSAHQSKELLFCNLSSAASTKNPLWHNRSEKTLGRIISWTKIDMPILKRQIDSELPGKFFRLMLFFVIILTGRWE